MLKQFFVSYSVVLLSIFLFSEAQAGDYCKVGRYFYNASASTCNGRDTNYCYSRQLGYRVCSSENTTNIENRTSDQAGFCKRGSYFYNSSDSMCRGRDIDYCYTRTRGYYRCESTGNVADNSGGTDNAEVTDEGNGSTTVDVEQAEGEYCKVGQYWHRADSPVCNGKPIDQCLINGRYGNCDRTEVASGGASVQTQGYQRMTCGSPQNPFQCMMCNCYHESRGEGYSGRVAVGKVVMTRARMSSYPNSVCSVVYQNSNQRYPQFSWTNQASRHNVMAREGYERCEGAVREALNFNGHYASHYHATNVYPKWRHNCSGRFQIGAHYFYSDCGGQSRANTGVQISI